MANLIKATTNALARLTGTGGGGRPPKANGQGIAPSLFGRLKAYDDAKEMAGRMKAYYGFDPGEIPFWTPEQLAQLADAAAQVKFFSDNLDKIDEHVKTYIKGVIDYNDFVARCVKAGVAGMKRIDKTTLDVFLGLQQHDIHTQMLGEKSRVETQKQKQEFQNFLDLSEYDLQTSFRIMASRLQKAKEEIAARPEQISADEAARQALADERKRVRNLIHYGTRQLPGSDTPLADVVSTAPAGKNIFQRFADYFSGR